MFNSVEMASEYSSAKEAKLDKLQRYSPHNICLGTSFGGLMLAEKFIRQPIVVVFGT